MNDPVQTQIGGFCSWLAGQSGGAVLCRHVVTLSVALLLSGALRLLGVEVPVELGVRPPLAG